MANSKRPTKIWFVIWPDGKIFERTQTSVSEAHAVGAAIRTWLPVKFFPDLDLGGLSFGVMASLWRSMEKSGFKCHCIEIDADGVSY
jgi:hypothetical protein